uniref:Palmitoyltransferase n=1 Tax=Astyanax mexicanus TaxID=7994 RepID=A0A8B9GVG1_ASTMX
MRPCCYQPDLQVHTHTLHAFGNSEVQFNDLHHVCKKKNVCVCVCVCRFGALDRCKELIEAGYDVRQPDKENVTLLHWAAINNRADLVKYYIAKGAVIDQLGGDLNSTPLHWAIRQGHLQMVIQLMRYGADPSLPDGEGYRGLHLAVLFQHMPIAAYMMAKGQEVDLPDTNGQTSLMLAICCIVSVNGLKTVNDLHHVCKKKNVCVCVCVFRQWANAAVQALIPSTALLASVFWMLITWYFWFLPDILYCATVQVLFTLTGTALLYYYLRACRTDPGVIRATEEEKKKNVVVLAEAGCLDPRIFCTSCMMKKPMRAQHCFICNTCVAKQDHHSVWINGCVGARNHHFFVMFLITLNLLGIWMFYGSLKYWMNHCAAVSELSLWGFVTGLVGCSPWVLYIFCLAFFHTAWASILLIHQIYQVAFLGLTTAERGTLMRSQRNMPQTFSLRQNPFNRGVLKNLVNFFQLRCCGLCKPMVLDWTQEFPMGLNRDHPMFNNMDPV